MLQSSNTALYDCSLPKQFEPKVSSNKVIVKMLSAMLTSSMIKPLLSCQLSVMMIKPLFSCQLSVIQHTTKVSFGI